MRLHDDRPPRLLQWLLLLVAVCGSSSWAVYAEDPASRVSSMRLGQTLFISGDRVLVEGEPGTVDDVYAAGGEVDVRGTFPGDLHATAANGRVDGRFGGDVNFAGGNARVEGWVEDDLRVFAADLELYASTGGDVIAWAGRIYQHPGSRIKSGALFMGGIVQMRGDVLGPVRIQGGEVELSGTIGGNAHVCSDKLVLGSNARIKGDLVYSARNEISVPPGVVDGEVRFAPCDDVAFDAAGDGGGGFLSFLSSIWLSAYLAVAALVAGLLMVIFLHPFVQGAMSQAMTWGDLIVSFGVGLVSMLVMLMLGLLCLVLAPLGLGIWAALAALIYFGGLVGKMIAGAWLLRPFRSQPTHAALGLLLGVMLLFVAARIPVFGSLFWLFVTVTGMGACLIRIRSAGKTSGPEPGAPGEWNAGGPYGAAGSPTAPAAPAPGPPPGPSPQTG